MAAKGACRHWCRDHLEAGRQRIDAVPVAHPHRQAGPRIAKPVEQRRRLLERNFRSAELALIRARDLSAKLRHHGLLAIADAEHRNARAEYRSSGARGVPISVTLAGPPDRMIALGRIRAMAASASVNGTISE